MAIQSILGMAIMDQSSKLDIIRIIGFTIKNEPIVLVFCPCGTYFTAFEHNVKSGTTKSCGCLERRK